MRRLPIYMIAALVLSVPSPSPLLSAVQPAAAPQPIDLAERWAAGTLRIGNREATRLEGPPGRIHVTERSDNGVVWIEDSDFAEGTTEVDVRGRDQQGRAFLGIAFHGKDDNTYECVYVRPFNCRTDDPVRHQHAVQYIALPAYDWPRLRKEFPEGQTIQIHVGKVQKPTLEIRKLGRTVVGCVGGKWQRRRLCKSSYCTDEVTGRWRRV